MAGVKVPPVARRPVRVPWTESMHGPMVVTRAVAPLTRKTVSVRGMEIAMRARATGRTQATGAAPTAVGHGVNLSEGDTEEPGRSDGNQFSQQHRCLDTKPNERARHYPPSAR
jgi:hypothetical protein